MRIAFFIHTTGQAHLWGPVILLLKRKGHEVFVVIREEESICLLLDFYGIKYITYGKPSKTGYGKIIQVPPQFLRSFGPVKKFGPYIIIGTGPIEAWISVLLRKPCIIFDDSEPIPFLERLSWIYIADAILTPICYRKNLGERQIRFAGYKELVYLHPNYFKPDPKIYNELGIGGEEKYVILRFNVFDAVHDIGRHGFAISDQFKLVKELGKYARVFISPEGALPVELEKHRLPISYDRIHHALYYAQLLVSDTQTMTTEAAILGTPVVRCNNFVGPNDMGNFVELEQKYDLIYSFVKSELAIQKAVELIQRPNLKEEWAKKRQILLNDKIDVTQFMVDFIENYLDRFERYRREAELKK